MKIVFLTDSYGGPRVHKNIVSVTKEQTYPELVKAVLEQQGHQVEVDYASFRRVVDLPELMKKYPGADVYIFQAGVVDVYPRVLNQKMTLSQSFFAKSIRRIIRLNRAFFVKYVHSKSWSTNAEICSAIEQIVKTPNAKFVWINVAPVNKRMDKETPGYNQSLINFNALLKEQVAHLKDVWVLDAYGLLLSQLDFDSYIHEGDSHLNVKGNQLYAQLILDGLSKNSILQ